MKQYPGRVGLGLAVVGALTGPAWPAPTGAARSGAVPPPLVDVNRLLAPPAEAAQKQREEQRDLQAALDEAREPLDRAVARLAMANWLLAVPTARPATRWLLGLEESTDTQTLARSAREAADHLGEAQKLIQEQSPAGASSSEKMRVRRLTGHLKALQAFAGVLRAAESSEKPAAETWSELALALSEPRESENPQLASAAVLWQALSWERAGRRERALTTLPEALARPEQPFDFVSRLLRCRLLADGGEYGGALALAAQISTNAPDWFSRSQKSNVAARVRLVGLVQFKIGQAWADRLKTGTRPADAELLGDLLGDIRKSLFPDADKPPEVYVLERAVPILVPRPAVLEPRKETAETEPAPKPPPASSPAEAPDEDRPAEKSRDE